MTTKSASSTAQYTSAVTSPSYAAAHRPWCEPQRCDLSGNDRGGVSALHWSPTHQWESEADTADPARVLVALVQEATDDGGDGTVMLRMDAFDGEMAPAELAALGRWLVKVSRELVP